MALKLRLISEFRMVCETKIQLLQLIPRKVPIQTLISQQSMVKRSQTQFYPTLHAKQPIQLPA